MWMKLDGGFPKFNNPKDIFSKISKKKDPSLLEDSYRFCLSGKYYKIFILWKDSQSVFNGKKNVRRVLEISPKKWMNAHIIIL